VFLADPVDTFYKNRRMHATVVSIACNEPEETCFCSAFDIHAENPDGDVAAWIAGDEMFFKAKTEKGEALLEGVAAHYGRLLEHPLDINGAVRRELENMYLLSDFQIESILEYRRVSGNILSATELSLLHGFSSSDVKLLEPFIVFGNGSAPWKTDGRSGVSELLLKWWWKDTDENYLGPPFYSRIKYKWEMPQKLQAGFMLEKDAGERVTGKRQVPLGDFALISE
jgi:hypothetical protein